MSETTIQGKLPQPSIKTSSLDSHRIITQPVPRPGKNQARPAQNGEPLRQGNHDVQISRPPAVEHVTANSSSRQVRVDAPTTPRQGTQQPNPKLVPARPPVGNPGPSLPFDQAEFLVSLVAKYKESLPAEARASRSMADAALGSLKAFTK
jgi:hypothetical protein